MPKSAADVAAEMILALAASDPELDTSVGSVVRKILDVTAEQIAPAYAEADITESWFDVTTKTGDSLDDFVTMFGIPRLPGRRATGVVTFSRPTPTPETLAIPAGTQIATSATPPVLFATVTNAVLMANTTKVSVPVEALLVGASGNLPSDALINLTSQMPGITSSTSQSDATFGGVNAESDESLRARFKRTLFKSIAGTEDMFVAMATTESTPDDPIDTIADRANVLGVSKRWREQVQTVLVGASLEATSMLPVASAKYIFTGNTSLGLDIDGGQVLTEGVHYTFIPTSPPKVVSIGTGLDDGAVYDLEFEYTPAASRNDPVAGVTNKVDIWVSGESPQGVDETAYWVPRPFVATPGDPMNVSRFLRMSDSAPVAPASTSNFIQLGWGPIMTFPNTLNIGGTTYLRNTDYWVVHDDTAEGYSPSSLFGLEFRTGVSPVAGSPIVLSDTQSYTYNRLPADVEARANKAKLVTTDIKAHAAKPIRLALNFAIMYSPNYERGYVQSEVDRVLSEWMSGLGFHPVVQVSDILDVAHSASGVDNIRFLNSAEPGIGGADTWGIQRVSANGTHLAHDFYGTTTKRARDVVLAENEVPVLYDARYTAKAQNTFTEPA